MDLRRFIPADAQRHSYKVVQHLRCVNCGARYVSKQRTCRTICRGTWWTVDGEPHYFIDGQEVSEGEWHDRCPRPLLEVSR
jgi:hypothetical protein